MNALDLATTAYAELYAAGKMQTLRTIMDHTGIEEMEELRATLEAAGWTVYADNGVMKW